MIEPVGQTSVNSIAVTPTGLFGASIRAPGSGGGGQ